MQDLTTAEEAQLLKLRGRVESARNFTSSARASDRLDTYVELLIEKGRATDQIIALIHP